MIKMLKTGVEHGSFTVLWHCCVLEQDWGERNWLTRYES